MKAITPNLHVARVLVRNAGEIIPHIGRDLQIVRGECLEEVAFAGLLALRSLERGTSRARTPGGELLLRLSGKLQIREAIAERGIKKGENYLVVFGPGERAREIIEELKLEELPLIECEREKLKTFFERAALVEAL